MNVKLFTHTDLDGVGCAVIAETVYGTANVNTTFCNYKELNNTLMDFFKSDEFNSFDIIYITDLNLDSVLLMYIHDNLSGYPINVIDHHMNRTVVHDDRFIIMTHNNVNKPESATSLFAHFVHDNVMNQSLRDSIGVDLLRFAEYVRIYDTFEFRNNTEFANNEEIVNTVLVMNSSVYTHGYRDFINSMVERIINKGPMVTKSQKETFRVLKKIEDEYIESVMNNPIICNDYIVAFADKYISNLGFAMTSEYPNRLAVIVNMQKGLISLRSNSSSNIDCSKIAECYGGGGHVHAAGFPLSNEMHNNTINSIMATIFGINTLSVPSEEDIENYI